MVNQQFTTAIHIMTSLAYGYGDKTHSDALAEGMRTHPVVVRRILAALGSAGLVISTRGKSGGVQLAKKPSQINLAEIYTAVVKKSALNKTDKPVVKECPVSCSMIKIIDSVVKNVDLAIYAQLQKIKLSDLTKEVQEK